MPYTFALTLFFKNRGTHRLSFAESVIIRGKHQSQEEIAVLPPALDFIPESSLYRGIMSFLPLYPQDAMHSA